MRPPTPLPISPSKCIQPENNGNSRLLISISLLPRYLFSLQVSRDAYRKSTQGKIRTVHISSNRSSSRRIPGVRCLWQKEPGSRLGYLGCTFLATAVLLDYTAWGLQGWSMQVLARKQLLEIAEANQLPGTRFQSRKQLNWADERNHSQS